MILLFNFLQMWTPGQLYLPPSRPVARIMTTDEYVKPTELFYYGSSDRLITVGNPYYPIMDTVDDSKVIVPKVSGSQFRVFKINLPDPNKFAFDQSFYNPETQRLVWRLVGLEIGRGGPLGIGVSGHPFFNKLNDTENPNKYVAQTDDDRQNVSFDPKQSQVFIVGQKPATGMHWTKGTPCEADKDKKELCPPLELVNTQIEDGNMADIGLGALDFRELQKDKSSAPLDIVTETCKWPDFMKMAGDTYGDELWFFGRREQLYARHYWVQAGVTGEPVPSEGRPSDYFITPSSESNIKMGPVAYMATPSGSLTSTDSQLFNRPYWLQRAQGPNNGVCWLNEMYVTVLDNTRNTNFMISIVKEEAEHYKNDNFYHFSRHAEIYELSFIFNLCTVSLEGNILAHIHAMNSKILEQWNLGFIAVPTNSLETAYRFQVNKATSCQPEAPPEEPPSPSKFWVIDMTDRLTSDLEQSPLGRKFLTQWGIYKNPPAIKRKVSMKTVAKTKRRKVVKKSTS